MLAIILLLLALVWALLAGLPEGMGGDGSGDGMGASVGAGVGEGIDGEQSGEGEDGEEGSESGGDDEPSTSAPGEPSEAPAGPPSSQAAGPSLQPDEPQPLGFAKRVETPPAASGDSSEAGARGGGSHGRSNVGADPGARGDASFTLVWSYDKNRQGTDGTGGPDIDMWVDEPGGGRLSTSRDGSALGPSPHGGRIDHDDMGAYGEGNGGGPERAFWPTGNAPKGSYKYGVRWFQGQGTVQCTVRVYRGSKLVETKKKTLTAPASGRTGPPVELGTLDVE